MCKAQSSFTPDFRWSRVFAMVRRYWYLLRSSWPRVLDLIYWPTVQMCMWGSAADLYRPAEVGALARTAQTFIGAVMLWDILFRGQLGFSISFLEEMYFAQSLQPADLAAAACRVSRLADGDERRAARYRHGAGHAAGDCVLRI